MIRNNQNGRRRGRGGGAGGGGARPPQGAPSGGNYQPNRNDNRQRGNASQLLEKYKSLARDAAQQGDRVTAEYFMQYADHYYRVLNDYRSRENEARPQGRRDQEEDGDEGQNYNNGSFSAASDAAPNYGAQSYAARAEGVAEGDDAGDDDGAEAARDASDRNDRDGNRGREDDNRAGARDDNRAGARDDNRAGARDDNRAGAREEAPLRAGLRPRRDPAPVADDAPVIQGLPPAIELGAESDDMPPAPRRGRGRPRKVVAEAAGDAEG